MRFWSLFPLCALVGIAGFGFTPFRGDPAVEGNRLFKEGKYQDAISKYGEALVDDPDSKLLNFNMGLAHYKAGNYADAVASLSRVPTGGDPKREAKVAYNIGNAQYQLASAKEIEKPKEALEGYAQALVTYRRAIGADPSAQDAKHNYEFVYTKMLDLKRRMEEQRKQQQDQQQDQQNKDGQDDQKQDQDQQQQQGDQGQDEKQDQQQQDQQDQAKDEQGQDEQEGQDKQEGQDQQGDQQEQQAQDQGEPSEDQKQAGGGEQKQDQAGGQEQAAQGEQAGEKSDERSDAQKQAAAVIDMGADEELRPDEFSRKLQKAGVAEAAQDW